MLPSLSIPDKNVAIFGLNQVGNYNNKKNKIVKHTHKSNNIDVDIEMVITMEAVVWDETVNDQMATTSSQNAFA